MVIRIILLGVFKKAFGEGEIIFPSQETRFLGELLKEISESCIDLKSILLDSDLNSPFPNAVILVNGIEINLLDGLETPIFEGDEIVLIPVTHGG